MGIPLDYHRFDCPSGGFMRWAAAKPVENARGTVLICPGWSEWIEKYEEIIAEWRVRHFDVIIVEWQGQGLSGRFLEDRSKAWLPGFAVLVDDLAAFYDAHLAKKKAVLLFAHSMGAHLALRWRVDKGRAHGNLKAIILSGILHEPNTAPFPLFAAKLIAGIVSFCGHSRDHAPGQAQFDQAGIPFSENLVTYDEARYQAMVRQLHDTPALKVGGVTFGWLQALFASTAYLFRALKRNPVTDRCLVLGSHHDRIVTPAGIRAIARLLPHAEAHFFNNAHHEIFQEADPVRKAAWAKVDEFIKPYV